MGLSLSQSDREWLADKLIMPVQIKDAISKDDALAKFLEMEGIWSEDAEGEEYYQMMKHRNDGRPLNREINLDDYVDIRHTLATQGLRIGEFDILIAVTARHFGLTVVTHNTKHFSNIPGIQCVDWVNG